MEEIEAENTVWHRIYVKCNVPQQINGFYVWKSDFFHHFKPTIWNNPILNAIYNQFFFFSFLLFSSQNAIRIYITLFSIRCSLFRCFSLDKREKDTNKHNQCTHKFRKAIYFQDINDALQYVVKSSLMENGKRKLMISNEKPIHEELVFISMNVFWKCPFNNVHGTRTQVQFFKAYSLIYLDS